MTDTVAELLLSRAEEDRIGLRDGDESMTWAEVVRAGAARATWLDTLRRDGPFHVATLLDNTTEHVLWLGGAALAGAVIVGGNPTHRGPDLARDLAHTRCQLLVTDSAHVGLVDGLDLGEPIGVGSPENPRILVVDAPGYAEALSPFSQAAISPFAETEPSDPRHTRVKPNDLGYLIFTSGTSGAPKACRCTQGRLAFVGAVLADRYKLGGDDCCYVAMPLFHSNALMAGWAPALAGGATVALPTGGKFSASGFLADVRRHRVTYFNYVGKPLAYILATPAKPDDAENPLQNVFGNEASQQDVARFAERFGCSVADNYGSTEGGLALSRTADTPPSALGPAPPDLVIVNVDSGEECPPAIFDSDGRIANADEAIGEMVSTTGGAGFEGYWENQAAESARVRDGRYWTGDLGYKDEAGFVYFAGRADDWLRVDGENFAAAPLARLLERHPDVVLAAVYAVADPVVGDQVMAALQLRPESQFDPEGFAKFLLEQTDLGTKWAPRFVRVSESLPITATSKVLVRSLRSDAWHCDDPVYWRRRGRGDDEDEPYRPMTENDVGDLDRRLANRRNS